MVCCPMNVLTRRSPAVTSEFRPKQAGLVLCVLRFFVLVL